MNYLIAQICGMIATAACVTVPLFPKKVHMLMDATAVNFFLFLNYILLGDGNTAYFVCAVATVQSLLSIHHTRRGQDSSRWEMVIFFLLYLGFGVYGVVSAPGFTPALTLTLLVQCLPVVGSLLNMCFTFVRDERKARLLLLITDGIWALYSAIIGATAFFGQFIAAIMALCSMVRFGDFKKKSSASQAA